MKLLFLDVDGVLNTSRNRHGNGYNSLSPVCVHYLCEILRAEPDVRIVLSSAWRYLVPDAFTLKGFEYLLCIFGAPGGLVTDRFVGVTDRDEATAVALGAMAEGDAIDWPWITTMGRHVRALQILEYVNALDHRPPFVVLDDLDLQLAQQVRVDAEFGLRERDVIRAVEILRGHL